MGKVVRNPEKRFTTNNLPITSFGIDISTGSEEETVVRVIAIGKIAETTAETVKKGVVVIVDGRLQTNTVKTESGEEKKVVEINAQSIEVTGGAVSQDNSEPEEILQFSEELSADDLIGEDEIPF